METIIRPLGAPGDLGWVVQAHGEDYADEFGWDTTFEGGQRAGCVFCVPYDEATAQLRILLVRPAARGLGLGRALVETCVDFARHQHYTSMRLWTNDVLAAARRIYLDCGFRLVDEEPHHSFGVDLVGQTYVLPLTP
jgi:GNAT superfamily N-acetyltransferase